jgi:hypothetical protein
LVPVALRVPIAGKATDEEKTIRVVALGKNQCCEVAHEFH